MSGDAQSPRLSEARSRTPSDARGRWRAYAALAMLLLVLAALMLYPLAYTVVQAFTPVHAADGKGWLEQLRSGIADGWIRRVLSNGPFMSKVVNSLLLATVVTVLCNLIAMPLAAISHRYRFRGKAILAALVLSPMVLPPFVGAVGMRQMLGKFGALTMTLQHLGILGAGHGVNWLRVGGFWACAVLITLGLYPIAYLNLQAALANIDPAMLEAAENMGGRRWRNFFRITLPLARPGIFAGSTIIFIWAFTELGTPLVLDYPNVVSREIFDMLSAAAGGNSFEGSAKVVVVLTISVLAYLIGKNTLGRQVYAMTSKAAVASVERRLGFLRGLLAALPFAAVIFLALLPHIGVVLYSLTAIATEKGVGWGQPGQFGWYRSVLPTRFTATGYAAVFNTPDILTSIFNSFKYSVVATAVDIVLGVSVAWVLVRTRIWGRSLLDGLAMLPLAVPGLVLAFGYLVVSQQDWYLVVTQGWFHLDKIHWLWHWPFFDFSALLGDVETVNTMRKAGQLHPFIVLAVSYSVRRMPYLVRSATSGLQQTSVTLEEAAANLGASPLRTILKITLPLIAANIIAGSILTFSFSMLEVSDSIMLAPLSNGFPITKMIYQLANDTSGAENVRNACALGVLAMLLLVGTMVSASLLMGKRLGAVFRA